VDKSRYTNNNPLIIISRTAPEFLERLFESGSARDKNDGLITIKKMFVSAARACEVAVESYDDRVTQ